MFVAMITLLCTAIGVLFTSCAQSPGTAGLANASLPLTEGFSRIFGLSPLQARWLSFPALYGNFYGFVWVSGRQLSSMAKSGLLPDACGLMTKATDTPYVALLVGMTGCIVLALLSYYDAIDVHFKEDVKHIFMLSSYVIAISLFISYIVFKQRYSSLERSFSSPLGIYGAIVGMFIFGCNTVAILINNGIYQTPFVILIVTVAAMSIYYFIVLHGNQHFSEEEKEKLFKAYLINGESF
jgi:amino acid transporter